MAHPPKNTGKNWFRYFQYNDDVDSPSDVRNVLLVVAALIATVTFQAGVTPPGGVWQDDDSEHTPGKAVLASQQHPYYVFLFCNTLALSSSLLVIVSLTHRFPFQIEIWVATLSMIGTYASAISAVSPHESIKFHYVLLVAAVPLVLRCLIQLYKKYTSAE